MATVAHLADQISTLSSNAVALTSAVQALVANAGGNQATFEASLEPLSAALEQVNAALGTLLGVVNAAATPPA